MRRLTPATLTLMMFGVMGLLVTAYIGKSLFARTEVPPAPPPTRNVPMPVADIPAGTEITADHLGLGPMRIADLQSDMLVANRVIVGRITKEDLKKASPIRAGQLYEPGQRPPLKVGKGMQAVTIEIASTPALVDGLIKPNEYCDLHLNLKPFMSHAGLDNGAQVTLLQCAHILAINGSVTQKTMNDVGNTVTLELPPDLARMVLFAKDMGVLWMTYNPNKGPLMAIDIPEGQNITMPMMLSAMGFTLKVDPPAPLPPPSTRVYQYRGLAMSQVRFFANGEIAAGGYGYGGWGGSQAIAGQPGSGGGYDPGAGYGAGLNNGAGFNNGTGGAIPGNPGTGTFTPNSNPNNGGNAPQLNNGSNAAPGATGPSAQLVPQNPRDMARPTAWATPTQSPANSTLVIAGPGRI